MTIHVSIIYFYFYLKLQQNISIAIVSRTEGSIVGALIMAITQENYKIHPTVKKNGTWYSLVENLQKQFNIYQQYHVEDAIDFVYLCTHKDFRGNGFASKVMEAAVCFIKNFKVKGIVLHGSATWKSSQRVFEKTGFSALAEVVYAEYRENGEAVCTNLGEHKSAKYYSQIIW